jgi:hypothetical protein
LPVHLPLPGSPAIDAGDPDFIGPPEFDQNGLPRVVNGRIDIGAVEIQPPPPDEIFRDGFEPLPPPP